MHVEIGNCNQKGDFIMGIRMDQLRGLPAEAEKFLEENVKRTEIHECFACHNKTGGVFIQEECGRYAGMFAWDNESDEGTYPLFRYSLKDGGYAEEYEQAAPWSSGPVIFLGLRIVTRNEVGELERKIEWSEAEIELESS